MIMMKLDEILQELLKLDDSVQNRIDYGIEKLKLCISDLNDIDPKSTDYMSSLDYASAVTHIKAAVNELPEGDQRAKLKQILQHLRKLKQEIETDRVCEFKKAGDISLFDSKNPLL
jgi:phosphoglycerate-specific signal transduction histidine kinase